MSYFFRLDDFPHDMSTQVEDLKAWKFANDVEIAELKKDIKGL